MLSPSKLSNLSTVSLFLIACVSLLAFYLIPAFISYRRLRAFPGPTSTFFSYIWIIRALRSGKMSTHFTALNDTYGSTVRMGPNELLTTDPALIKRTSAARAKYTRSSWYKLNRLDPYDDAMLTTLDTKKHDDIKARTAPGYAGKDGNAEEIIDKFLGTVVRVLRERYATGGVEETRGDMKMLDLARMAQYFTLDSIGEIAFGAKFELVEKEKDVFGHIAMLDEIAPFSVLVSGVPYLRAVLGADWVLKLIGPKEDDTQGIGRILPLARKLVAERFGPEAKHKDDMLGSFVRHGLTQRQCETEAIFQLVAGSDTTATAIRATLLYIITTPRVYNALQAEIDAAIRSGAISSPITNAEAAELPYLQGVIYEGLRLHPPFTGIPMKVVPPEGDTVDGKFIPGGTRIAPSIWATGRLKGVFGHDAELFRPERWLEVADQQRVDMKRIAELVFGYGRWGCAGKAIAFVELNKVFVELLRHFDFQLVYPYEPWKSVNYNLFLQHDMWVTVTSRPAAQNPVL
ncbi:Pisatin demethylase [Podospora australis]|uniref:Cytochrome P450 monooxygenase ABA1 n=1 Tax=Podospora australis TaxID=1536484 RepID=A0AAN6WNC8_9PEZI|nr:Pisatin demethylase [Podospora australis]